MGRLWFVVVVLVFIGAYCLPPMSMPAWADRTLLGIFAVLFGSALIVAVLGIGRMVVKANARWRLLRIGRPTKARVLEIKTYGAFLPTLDDIAIVQLKLELVSETPPRVIDLQETVDADCVPKVGDEIMVLIHPFKARRHRLAPDFSC